MNKRQAKKYKQKLVAAAKEKSIVNEEPKLALTDFDFGTKLIEDEIDITEQFEDFLDNSNKVQAEEIGNFDFISNLMERLDNISISKEVIEFTKGHYPILKTLDVSTNILSLKEMLADGVTTGETDYVEYLFENEEAINEELSNLEEVYYEEDVQTSFINLARLLNGGIITKEIAESMAIISDFR